MTTATTTTSAGTYEIDERMMLQVAVTSTGPARGTWWALNEAVLEMQKRQLAAA